VGLEVATLARPGTRRRRATGELIGRDLLLCPLYAVADHRDDTDDRNRSSMPLKSR